MRLLYVTDRGAVGDERFRRLLSQLADAPGLSVSLRERGASDRAVLELAIAARDMLGPRVSLFLHRRLDIAFAARADGVQLPENGLPLARVRAAAPRPLRVGISTHSAAGGPELQPRRRSRRWESTRVASARRSPTGSATHGRPG